MNVTWTSSPLNMDGLDGSQRPGEGVIRKDVIRSLGMWADSSQAVDGNGGGVEVGCCLRVGVLVKTSFQMVGRGGQYIEVFIMFLMDGNPWVTRAEVVI